MIEAMTRSERRLGAATDEIERERGGSGAAMAPAQIGMAAVYVVIGYEWLLSGVNKLLLGPDFARGMSQLLRGGLAANPDGWFARFTDQVVLPHAASFAVAVQIGELAIAAGFLAGAVAWARGDRLAGALARWIDPIVVGALAASAVMAASYAMLNGDGLPLPNPVNAFAPGFSIDLLLALVAVLLLPAQVAHAIARRRTEDANQRRSLCLSGIGVLEMGGPAHAPAGRDGREIA